MSVTLAQLLCHTFFCGAKRAYLPLAKDIRDRASKLCTECRTVCVCVCALLMKGNEVYSRECWWWSRWGERCILGHKREQHDAWLVRWPIEPGIVVKGGMRSRIVLVFYSGMHIVFRIEIGYTLSWEINVYTLKYWMCNT